MWRVISAPRSDGTARIDRPFGVRTPAATENWRTAGETRPLLLAAAGGEPSDAAALRGHGKANRVAAVASGVGEPPAGSDFKRRADRGREDRKSTRLNSSHGYISYAVFCLKKKNNKKQPHT